MAQPNQQPNIIDEAAARRILQAGQVERSMEDSRSAAEIAKALGLLPVAQTTHEDVTTPNQTAHLGPKIGSMRPASSKRMNMF